MRRRVAIPLTLGALVALALVFAVAATPIPKRSAHNHLNCIASAVLPKDELHRLRKRIDWSYEGANGPANWGHINASYTTCSAGMHQSPINLDATVANTPTLPVEFAYPDVFEEVEVENLGTTIELMAPDKAAHIVRDGVVYNLAQFHVHSPSEHHLMSNNYDAELHFVHKSEDGKIHVLGMFVTADPNNNWPDFYQMFLDAVPLQPMGTPGKITGFPIGDVVKLFMETGPYWTYEGSLTTPPCTEGVRWMVANAPLWVNSAQIWQTQSLMPFNSRYTQNNVGASVAPAA